MRTIYLTLLLLSYSFFNSFAQTLTPAQQKFLNKNIGNIQVNKAYQNGQWEPLLKAVKNKKIVLLGEFNHGSKEVFVTRNELIKELHKKHGFNVILFESGIGEVATVDQYRKRLNETQMNAGLFGPWRTKEFRDLMEWIKKEDIAIAGFDVQRSGGNSIRLVKDMSRQAEIDTTYYQGLEKRYGLLKKSLSNYRSKYDLLAPKVTQLIAAYQQLDKRLATAKFRTDHPAYLLARRTITNRISYLSYMLAFQKNKDWNQRWKARDEMMAKNVKWLMENCYPTEKIIIVAHNFHIAKYNEKEEVMGAFLTKEYGKQMYVVGVFAGQGEFHGNRGEVQSLSPADTSRLDIKHVIQAAKHPVSFLKIPNKIKKGAEWLFQKITVNDTFIDLSKTHEMNLSKHFDALILLDRVSVPEP